MERCPVCRAKVTETPQCRRCKTDLSTLLALEEKAELLIKQAIKHLYYLDYTAARIALAHSQRICPTPMAAVLLEFCQYDEINTTAQQKPPMHDFDAG